MDERLKQVKMVFSFGVVNPLQEIYLEEVLYPYVSSLVGSKREMVQKIDSIESLKTIMEEEI